MALAIEHTHDETLIARISELHDKIVELRREREKLQEKTRYSGGARFFGKGKQTDIANTRQRIEVIEVELELLYQEKAEVISNRRQMVLDGFEADAIQVSRRQQELERKRDAARKAWEDAKGEAVKHASQHAAASSNIERLRNTLGCSVQFIEGDAEAFRAAINDPLCPVRSEDIERVLPQFVSPRQAEPVLKEHPRPVETVLTGALFYNAATGEAIDFKPLTVKRSDMPMTSKADGPNPIHHAQRLASELTAAF